MKSYENESMLNMIFENRNKSYGAYQLRLDYSQRISRAMLIMISFLICLGIGKSLPGNKKTVEVFTHETIIDMETIDLQKLEKETKEIDPPQPPKTNEAAGVSTIRDTEMRVIENDELASDSIPTVEQMRNIDPGITTNLTGNTVGATDGLGQSNTFEVTQHSAIPVPELFITVEKMPAYPGGQDALLRFVKQNTSYPDIEKELDIEGKAYIKFIVDENGKVTNPEILRTDSKGFGKEGVRVVGMLKDFEPGEKQGRRVKVQMVLPFTFRMN